MRSPLFKSLALAAIIAAITPAHTDAATAYTISSTGQRLLRFDTAAPGAVTTVGNFSGALTALEGLDFRPSNGLLYGYNRAGNAVVIVDPNTAFTTLASTPSTGSSSIFLGMDFNPVVDRLRLVNSNDQNLRINVDTGATLVDGVLAYAAGDPNFGVNPSIIDAAYTNSDTNPATGTSLFYIDIGTDTLVTTSNPNAGVLNTVGALGVNSNTLAGFDINTDPLTGVNSAFAVLSDGANVSRFYSINLGTGAASLIGDLQFSGGGGVNAFGLAIAPSVVPEPGSALTGLLVFGLCGSSSLRRRRQARA